jgi:dipeptidyl aminopeptidase/acylaminoacyl peptidase
MTQFVVSYTNRFAAASENDGLANVEIENEIEYRRAAASNYLMFSQMFGGAPWEVEYPNVEVQKVQTPLLMRHGARPSDPVHPESFFVASIGLYISLDQRHIPVEMIVHPKEGHGVFTTSTLRAYIDRDLNWFDYWLLDKPYIDPERQPEFDEWKRAHGSPRLNSTGR